MEAPFEIIVTSVVAFASTNIDDIVILTLFLGSKKYKPMEVYIGQYVGIASLVIVSLAGAWLGTFVESKYIGLLGLFPIYLSVRQVISLLKKDTESEAILSAARSRWGFISVALVTMANGGDNVGTYIPLMTPLSPVHKMVMVCVFMVLVFVWLMAARALTRHPQAKPLISRYGHIAMPICLFVLGIYILYENGSFALLM